MTTTVRVAVPQGSGGTDSNGNRGVRIKYGTQVAEVPVGGVHTFYLYDGQNTVAEIHELGSESSADLDALVKQRDDLFELNRQLQAELDAVRNAVNQSEAG